MKNKFNEAFDAIEPDRQKKQETVEKLINCNEARQAGNTKQSNRRFVWNIRRSIIAASTAAILIYCAVFIPLIARGGDGGDSPLPISAGNLMQGITANPVNERNIDHDFKDAAADFSIELFKKSFSGEENSLISATSVLLALAMTANGADGETLAQMETVLGKSLSLQQLNEYLYSYVKNLPSGDKSKLEIANSIWFRENALNVNPDFLQTNADYYDAAAYGAPFDDSTVADINNWVDNSTDGLIKEILKQIPGDAVMYLINCVLFDAEWQNKYTESSVYDGQFTSYRNEKQATKFMLSEESLYLSGEGATGFIKPYFGNQYSFAAILPGESIAIEQYVSSLTGEKFLGMVANASPAKVKASLPKFEYEYELSMNGALKAMGMNNAFSSSGADFSKIGTARGNMYISDVRHKAFISVDEAGTKAGAVTSVEMSDESVPNYVYVKLDRPFLYAIIDNASGLPIFMGTYITAV